jgi:voltage-gated potassium channel
MKKKVYNLIARGSHGSQINLIFDYVIISLIILNTVASAIDTLTNLPPSITMCLRIFELISISIFTVEYILRIYISDLTHPSKNRISSAFKFIFSFFGLIDLFAILPFYLPLVVKVDLRFLRMIRLVRFLRILKINRYNSSLTLIRDVLREKRTEIGITFFIAILILLISGFTMYCVENPVQPDKFPNLFASLWWAVATLTTVGYGDIYPITTLGKAISSIVAFLGIGLIALPTGIISSGFITKLNQSTNEKPIICPHCGKEIKTNL